MKCLGYEVDVQKIVKNNKEDIWRFKKQLDDCGRLKREGYFMGLVKGEEFIYRGRESLEVQVIYIN